MRLKTNQLDTHIKKSSLAPLYFISGEEPFQKLEATDKLRTAATKQGYTERVVLDVEANFDWDVLTQSTANLSLFASRKLVELRLGTHKPGKAGGEALTHYIETAGGNNLLLINSDKLDKSAQNARWFKQLDKAGVIIQIWPMNCSQLRSWITNRFKSKGKVVAPEAVQLIHERVEGNLLAAQQEIDKLCLLIDTEEISVKQITNSMTDCARYDAFALIEAAYAGDVKRALKILERLQHEVIAPQMLYGALIWDLRRTCELAQKADGEVPNESVFRSLYIWDRDKQAAIKKMLYRYSLSQLYQLFCDLIELEKNLRTDNQRLIWDSFTNFVLQLSGVQHSNMVHN